MSQGTPSRFDVVIPFSGRTDRLRYCISSLARTAGGGQVRIVLVADPGEEDRAAAARGWGDGGLCIDVVALPRPAGPIAAYQAGIEAGSAEFVVLAPADSCATPGWTECFAACFDSDPAIGIATPLGNLGPFNAIAMPPGQNHIDLALSVSTHAPRFPDTATTDASFMALRRSMLESIGGFDPLYVTGCADGSELAMRAGYLGWRTALVDHCFIFRFGCGDAAAEARAPQNRLMLLERWRHRHVASIEAMDRIPKPEPQDGGKASFPAIQWI